MMKASTLKNGAQNTRPCSCVSVPTILTLLMLAYLQPSFAHPFHFAAILSVAIAPLLMIFIGSRQSVKLQRAGWTFFGLNLFFFLIVIGT